MYMSWGIPPTSINLCTLGFMYKGWVTPLGVSAGIHVQKTFVTQQALSVLQTGMSVVIAVSRPCKITSRPKKFGFVEPRNTTLVIFVDFEQF